MTIKDAKDYINLGATIPIEYSWIILLHS